MAEIDRQKAALIAEIEVSRGEIRTAARRVENSADLVERARRNISKNLSSWLVGGTIGGFVISRLLPRGRRLFTNTPSSQNASKSFLSSGVVLSVAKVAFDLLRPALLNWASNRFSVTGTHAQHQDHKSYTPQKL